MSPWRGTAPPCRPALGTAGVAFDAAGNTACHSALPWRWRASAGVVHSGVPDPAAASDPRPHERHPCARSTQHAGEPPSNSSFSAPRRPRVTLLRIASVHRGVAFPPVPHGAGPGGRSASQQLTSAARLRRGAALVPRLPLPAAAAVACDAAHRNAALRGTRAAAGGRRPGHACFSRRIQGAKATQPCGRCGLSCACMRYVSGSQCEEGQASAEGGRGASRQVSFDFNQKRYYRPKK